MRGVKLLNSGEWPPQSPDMNPIEQLWPMVIRQLEGQMFSSAAAPWEALQAAFASATQSCVLSLYNSMARRMAAVLVANGGNTKY